MALNDEPNKHTGGPGVSGNPGGRKRQPDGPAEKPENSGRNPDGTFAKGNSANPAGKPKGARHRATRLAEELIDGQSEELIQRAVAMALGGDSSVMRALLDRLVPPRRERPVSIQLPEIKTSKDLIAASSTLMQSVAEGELVASEAAALGALLGNIASAIATADLSDRIAKLEAVQANKEQAA
jgi:Family of unknown function (DUF5681)